MTAGIPPAPYGRRRRPLFSRLALLVLIGLCILFASSYASRLIRKAEVEREIVQWQQRIAEAERHQQELQAELDYVNSPAYVEDVARNQLDMARDGDTVIVVVPAETSEASESAAEAVTLEDRSIDSTEFEQPTWTQWLNLLTDAE